MSTATLPRHDPPHDALRPRSADGLGVGALLALLAHGVLVLGLALGVSWRTADPEGVSAELWAAIPQVAAPPAAEPTPVPVPPPPPPQPTVKAEPPPPPAQREADIAIEREREKKRQLAEKAEKDKADREKAEKDKQRKAAEEAERQAEKKEAEKRQAEKQLAEKLRADEQRLAKQREENLKRMMGVAGGTGAPGSTGTAARDAGPSASYAGRVIARIKPHIVLTNDVAGDPRAEVEIKTAPDGTIVGRRITKPSGVKDWDDAVLRAIDRTEVLPRDVDGRVPGTLIIGFKPRD